MPQYRAPLEDFRFLLNDVLQVSRYASLPGFQDISAELIDSITAEGARLCEEVLFPLNQVGDREGLTLKDGVVTTPTGFKEAYRLYREGGWPSFTCSTEYGGQGLAEVLNMPMLEMACSANLSFGLTPGLSHGAYNLLMLHASDVLKQRFLPKLVSGEWAGVMCLTEPQAGTDLGLIRTQATPQPDGTYQLHGTKIFISSGEQDLTENILHLVLARLPDAPAGVKGISLFLVPKYIPNDDGTPGARNRLVCSGLEHKMGLHASPTCVMNYDGATGWLVGAPHRGLPAMFTMMNIARLYVGVQGLGIAEVAYQNALAYAKERLQGRALFGPALPEKPADPITVHADVRRMLLTMRALTEGCRALAMEVALATDISRHHADASARQEAEDFVQLMTPITKSFLTDTGTEVANLAIQVLGGYGYIREYGVEQYARDIRIAQIYEGTNGIQALDLIGRKLPHGTGRYLRSFFHPCDAFMREYANTPAMQEFIKPLSKHVGYLQQATLWMAKSGLSNKEDAAAGAVEYQRMFGYVVLGFMWAKQAAVAQQRMADNPEFYGQKLATARFYMARILPQTVGLLAALTQGSASITQAKLA